MAFPNYMFQLWCLKTNKVTLDGTVCGDQFNTAVTLFLIIMPVDKIFLNDEVGYFN